MPIPRDRFKGEVFGRREVTFEDPEPDDGQHDRANRDMHAMKACEHEERRPINAGR